MLYWAIAELGMTRYDAVWDIPIQTLMLCVLENQRQFNKNAITLMDKELIDQMNEKERLMQYGK